MGEVGFTNLGYVVQFIRLETLNPSQCQEVRYLPDVYFGSMDSLGIATKDQLSMSLVLFSSLHVWVEASHLWIVLRWSYFRCVSGQGCFI